jgi:serine/threonine protein kinase
MAFDEQVLDVPQYTFREKLHEGAAKVLCRAVRDADGAPVVLKLLTSEHPHPRELAQLRHEFTILRGLDVPGVVKAYALEAYRHTLALVLEDIAGEPLSDRVHGRPLDLGDALRIARSLAGILEGIHARGVIHKDVKPQNILIDNATQSVHLVDFGIATRLSQEAQIAGRSDSFEGTLAYLSPEQTGRMNRVVDYRTDFYSLGVTLYEMLTGNLPFESNDLIELVHSHIARVPTPPHERNPRVPAAVSAIVMKLLAKTAEDRYQQARGLAADLDECLAQLNDKKTVAPFPLGRRDISDRLQIPQKLYGREAETQALLSVFERVAHGRAELLLVKGGAGVGKSALVHEVHKAIARRGGTSSLASSTSCTGRCLLPASSRRSGSWFAPCSAAPRRSSQR